MRRALVFLALAIGCHFAAVALSMLFYLSIDAPDFPSPPDNPVYWVVFGTLMIAGLHRWRRRSG
jgi:hypothetical protein